jgi:hypothetical protein
MFGINTIRNLAAASMATKSHTQTAVVEMVSFHHDKRAYEGEVIGARLYRGMIYVLVKSDALNVEKWITENNVTRYWVLD